ncbi:Trypsin [Popillia japonica]|uniref:Trypsin n=1 Tax=Popillia japonica TaxID=7064 RepID=A0AAW1JC30_POPJA
MCGMILATVLPPIGSEVVILGFGEVDCTTDSWDSRYYPCEMVPSRYLRTAIVNVSNTGYGVLYTETRSRNGCHGDSGGPIVYQGAVVGVVTTGSHNGCSSPNTHLSIPAKYTWLNHQIAESPK